MIRKLFNVTAMSAVLLGSVALAVQGPGAHDQDNKKVRHSGTAKTDSDNRQNHHRGIAAAGLYRDTETWRNGGQQFRVRYSLNLSSEGHAFLDVNSLQDRNMPNNDSNTDPHGELLRYMHAGHDVIQSGTYTQNGSEITIHFDRIKYGRTQRSKSETMHGRLSGGVLTMDNFDKTFYGTDTLTFHEAS